MRRLRPGLWDLRLRLAIFQPAGQGSLAKEARINTHVEDRGYFR